MFNFKGKTAVITGGSRGIGRACAEKFAERGADVAIICASNIETAGKLCESLKAEYDISAAAYSCDVADFEGSKAVCMQITADFGGVDILINNAGITRDNLILRMSEKEFDEVIGVNLKGAFHMIKHLSRSLMKSVAGRVINISSVSGLMGNPGQANYAASKAGMIGLTKTVAKEFAAKKITCNAIAPGFIETDMTAGLPETVKDYVNTAVPLKRMGSAEEIANVALFLASEMSSYITGEIIRADGGMCM